MLFGFGCFSCRLFSWFWVCLVVPLCFGWMVGFACAFGGFGWLGGFCGWFGRLAAVFAFCGLYSMVLVGLPGVD